MFDVYLVAAGLVAAGFADYPLIAFHFTQAKTVSVTLVPIFYAVAMAVSGGGSLILGRVFDRVGIGMLIPLTIAAAAYVPLVFLAGFWPALIGAALWGLGMGVHEAIIPAAVAPMVSRDRRASAYGLFTGIYGIAWFLGSVIIGALLSVSLGGVARSAWSPSSRPCRSFSDSTRPASIALTGPRSVEERTPGRASCSLRGVLCYRARTRPRLGERTTTAVNDRDVLLSQRLFFLRNFASDGDLRLEEPLGHEGRYERREDTTVTSSVY